MNNNFLQKADMLSKKDIVKIVSNSNYSKGYEYSDQKSVLSWNLVTIKGESTLTAKVLGSKVYTVKVYYLGRSLVFKGECSCPAYIRTCKHIACVLITLTRVITDPSYDKLLHKSLFNPDVLYTNKVGLEIGVIANESSRNYRIKYLINPNKVDSRYKKFYSLIFEKISNAETIGAYIKHTSMLIRKALEDDVLVIHTAQGDFKPKGFDEKNIITKQISFTPAENGIVDIFPIAKFKDGTKLNKFINIENMKVFDLDTGTIYNTDPERQDFFKYFAQRDYILTSENDEIPLVYKGVKFQASQESDYFLTPIFSYDSSVQSAIEKDVIMASKDGSPVKQIYLKPILHIITDYYGLEFCVIGENSNSKVGLSQIFNSFINELNEVIDEDDRFNTDYIKSQAFKLLVTLGSKSQKELKSRVINAEVKQVLQDIKLKYNLNSYGSSLLNKTFEKLKKFILDSWSRSMYVYFLTKNNDIECVVIRIKELVTACTEIYNHVKKDAFMEFDFDSNCIFQMSEQKIEKHLKDILSIAKKWDLPVFFDKKSVRFSKASVFIDANRSFDLDWFEISPEIKVDDKLMDEADWLKMLDAGKHETLSTIELLDENSAKILNIIKKITNAKINTENKSNKDKNTVVQNKSLKIFELLELKNKGVNLNLPKQDQEILDSLGRFKKLKTEIIPAKLNTDLRDYQSEGFSWLVFLYKHKFGACLADDMGLGKTVQAIAFLAYISENFKTEQILPHLVVVPPSLVFNWENELQKFYPKLKVSSYFGPQRKSIPMDSDIIITTYDTVRVDTEKFLKEKFHVIIFDEAQAIKNIISKRTAAARSLVGKFILCLTGTPLENNISEFYSIMDLALPGLFPDYKEFKSWNKQEMVDFITERSKPFLLRRKKEAVLSELPEKTENDFYLQMSDSQKRIYQKIAGEIKDKISGAYQTKTEAQAAIIVLTAILRLRQVCVSPKLVSSSKQVSKKDQSPKLDYLADKLIELKQEGNAALVFSQFTKCLDLVETKLQKDKINYLRIDGSVPVKNRKAIIEKFQKEDSDVQVLLLSLKTGGVGLNLTRANHVFHVDPWWNPAVENQASDRVYRLGQKNHVTVTRILMKHSIEEKMMKLKKDKSELFRSIVEGAQAKVGKVLSKKDFDFLLS